MLTFADIARVMEKPDDLKRGFYEHELCDWLTSPERREMITAKEYYAGVQDIKDRKRTIFDDSGVEVEIKYLPNNRIVDNQYRKMIDQKTNYLFGKPFMISSENDIYLAAVKDYLNYDFQNTLHTLGKWAYMYGVSWLIPYYNNEGKLSFRIVPGYEVLPFWHDDDCKELDAAIRVYDQLVYEGGIKDVVHRVEIYEKDGLYRYILEGNKLVPDVELGDYEPYIHARYAEKDYAYNWERIPLIPFRCNREEIPMLRSVKSIQDAINKVVSDGQNQMEENVHNTVFVIRGYLADHTGKVRQNIASGGIINVEGEGDVKILTMNRAIEDYKTCEDLLQRMLESNARGFSAKSEQFSAYTNKMNLQSLYAEIDLDSNILEIEFKKALRELMWYIHKDLMTRGVGDFQTEEMRFTFSKDIITNVSEDIDNIVKSVGILSDQTLIEQHPFTVDKLVEMARIEKERKEKEEYDLFDREDTDGDIADERTE